jgi:hypothetical protein
MYSGPKVILPSKIFNVPDWLINKSQIRKQLMIGQSYDWYKIFKFYKQQVSMLYEQAPLVYNTSALQKQSGNKYITK